jgi:hypothetical protein
MKTHSPQNERIKRAYFNYLAEARGFSEATLDAVAKALNRFETYTKFRDFKAFHIEQAKGFKASGPNERPEQGSPEQGDAVRHAHRPEAVLHLAGRSAGLQVQDFVLGCRIFQLVGGRPWMFRASSASRLSPTRKAQA